MAALLGGLAVGWALQMWLVLRQTRAFHARLAVLRTRGTTAVGRNGSRMRGIVHVALAADAGGTVVAAEVMDGLTVFARLRPAPDLIGRSLVHLSRARESRRDRAAAQAADAILAAAADGTIPRLSTAAGARSPAAL